jgi:hypothetical protein
MEKILIDILTVFHIFSTPKIPKMVYVSVCLRVRFDSAVSDRRVLFIFRIQEFTNRWSASGEYVYSLSKYRILLSRVSIARGCRARQCSLLCLAKSIPCCRAAERTLPLANLALVEPNRSGFFVPRQRGFSVLCSFSWDSLVAFQCFFTAKWSVDQQPHAAAALRWWIQTRLLTHKQTNEFTAHEQLRAAAARNRYPALQGFQIQNRNFPENDCEDFDHISVVYRDHSSK